MNFIKFGKSGPNLQRLNFENFEKRRSGLRWFWVVGTKDYPESWFEAKTQMQKGTCFENHSGSK